MIPFVPLCKGRHFHDKLLQTNPKEYGILVLSSKGRMRRCNHTRGEEEE